jgi:hypothetical protein
MANNHIILSEKHGVNPTMGVCFWCGEHTGEIALLGKLPNDAEAPKETVLNYEPCEKCQNAFNEGVLIIEVDHTADKPPLTDDHYPTGRFVVLDPYAFTDQKYKAGDKCLLESDEFERMFGSIINN